MEKKSVVQELKDLQAMKDAGQLNEAEYAAAKTKVLNTGKPGATPPPGVPRPPSTPPKASTSAPKATSEQIMYPCPQGVPAGSTVTVTLNGQSFPVKIPPGTKPGDNIPVTLPPGVANPMKTGGTVQFSVQPQQQPARQQTAAAGGGAPAARGVAPGASGKWKDEWFEVLADPAVAVGGFFCMPLVLAQLWERVMNEPGACQKYAPVIIALWVFFFIFCYLMTNPSFGFVFNVLAVLINMVIMYVMIRLRRAIRGRDQIPETLLGPETQNGCEDTVCACFCGTCITCQMMRHDLKDQQYYPWSTTGVAATTLIQPGAASHV